MLRIIQEVKPRWIIGENVAGFVNMALDQSIADLENEGYEVQAFIIPACAVNAPHRRDRCWIVAHNNNTRNGTPRGGINRNEPAKVEGRTELPQPESIRQNGGGHGAWSENWYEVAQRLCVSHDGLPSRLAGHLNCLTFVETHGILGFTLMIREYFYETKTNAGTILSILQKAFSEETVQECFGRFSSFYKEEILRCPVHGESNDERECRKIGNSEKDSKTQKEELRKMWHEKLASCPPYRRGLEKQCSCEFDDIVRELSSEDALVSWEENAEEGCEILYNMWKESGGQGFLYEPLQALHEIWKSVTHKEIGTFRRHYYKRDDDRAARLKSLGNAIVPQVAYEIMKAIKEIDK